MGCSRGPGTTAADLVAEYASKKPAVATTTLMFGADAVSAASTIVADKKPSGTVVKVSLR